MKPAEIARLSSAGHGRALLLACGLKQRITPAVLAAAAELLEPDSWREEILVEARQFFAQHAGMIPHGLEEIPSRWLQQLPRHLENREMGPFMITSLDFNQGILCVAFAHEIASQTERMTIWDDLRFVLNLALQPNLWQSLSRKEELDVWNRRPSLRRELFSLD
jgi:hypothetical protein